MVRYQLQTFIIWWPVCNNAIPSQVRRFISISRQWISCHFINGPWATNSVNKYQVQKWNPIFDIALVTADESVGVTDEVLEPVSMRKSFDQSLKSHLRLKFLPYLIISYKHRSWVIRLMLMLCTTQLHTLYMARNPGCSCCARQWWSTKVCGA